MEVELERERKREREKEGLHPENVHSGFNKGLVTQRHFSFAKGKFKALSGV